MNQGAKKWREIVKCFFFGEQRSITEHRHCRTCSSLWSLLLSWLSRWQPHLLGSTPSWKCCPPTDIPLLCSLTRTKLRGRVGRFHLVRFEVLTVWVPEKPCHTWISQLLVLAERTGPPLIYTCLAHVCPIPYTLTSYLLSHKRQNWILLLATQNAKWHMPPTMFLIASAPVTPWFSGRFDKFPIANDGIYE